VKVGPLIRKRCEVISTGIIYKGLIMIRGSVYLNIIDEIGVVGNAMGQGRDWEKANKARL
jgi:hypothetical protein